MLLNPERAEFDLFVGSRIGSFKHIKYHTDPTKNSKKCIENLQEIRALEKEDGITCLRWASPEQAEVLVGRANQLVQVYDTELGEFTSSFVADYGTGHIVGLCRAAGKTVTALSGGGVRVWGDETRADLDAGAIDRMRVCPDDETLIATGGKENELKVWRLGQAAPTFAAKNVRHDWLELRAPVWATDVCFMPDCGGALVAVCSRYSTVRLYDTRAQRRPVCDIEFPKMAATCITPGFSDSQVIVGFGRGQLHAVDLRGRGRPDKGYKGSVGAITDIAVAPGPCVVSVSLDRHLKVHHGTSKELVYKQYLTSKLTCVLAQTARSTRLRHVKEKPPEGEPGGEPEPADGMDEIFEDMETVKDEKPSKVKTKPSKKRPAQKKKKMEVEEEMEATEIQSPESEPEEDGIAKLLKLTEKKKRKMEKMKKKKKAKSLFHNA